MTAEDAAGTPPTPAAPACLAGGRLHSQGQGRAGVQAGETEARGLPALPALLPGVCQTWGEEVLEQEAEAHLGPALLLWYGGAGGVSHTGLPPVCPGAGQHYGQDGQAL